MPFMDCIEVWKAECKCGEPITFIVEPTEDNDKYTCKCGAKYIVDRYAGHYHNVKEFDTEMIESKVEECK